MITDKISKFSLRVILSVLTVLVSITFVAMLTVIYVVTLPFMLWYMTVDAVASVWE